MKVCLPLIVIILCAGHLLAQLNTTLIGNLDYADGVNDVWGYVAPDSTEYAIVGLVNGISVVSLADPGNPVEVGRVAGTESPWRDMKTYREYAYAVADRGGDGITVIDLSQLPAQVTATNYLENFPDTNRNLLRAHNIYIDTTKGLAFTAGGDRNLRDGGILIYDLKADPLRPPLVGAGPEIYAHDVFVRDSLMFASEIYRGELAIYDIRDLDSIREVGRVATPFDFTHNAWSTADNDFVFTTDERGNASVAAYDIRNPGDIRLLDQYRPVTSLNTGSIPHNVHVIGEYLSISSYSDGLRVVDAGDPSNLVEVANYDTYTGPDGGFNGAWGAYPFLPSGLTLVSDRSTGLYVLDVDYQPAGRLTGSITDGITNEPIGGATVQIVTEQPNRVISDARGTFQTGVAGGGTLPIAVSALGYYSDTTNVSLIAGGEVRQDFDLQPRPTFDIALDVRDRETDLPVDGVRVNLFNPAIDYAATPDSNGLTELSGVYDYDYSVLVTVWGYQVAIVEGVNGSELDGTLVYLDRGYQDIFSTDLGWTVSGDAVRGQWERGTPTATFNRNGPGQPGSDAPSDFGNAAYVTGLAGGNSNSNDVDRGETVLTSPVMDLSRYGTGARLEYSYWFSNLDGERTPNDSLSVEITNGDTVVAVATYRESSPEWRRDTILLDNLIAFSDSVRLIVRTGDERSTDNLVEAVFDDFRLLDSIMLTSTPKPETVGIDAAVFPNPSRDGATLRYKLQGAPIGFLSTFDATGRQIDHRRLDLNRGSIRVGENLHPGLYFFTIRSPDRVPRTLRWIKQ
jgi:choice-of-anchor B domain-containing protein